MNTVMPDVAMPNLIDNAAESLARRAESRESKSVEQVAAEFESMFVSLVLKEMRQTLQEPMFAGDAGDSLGGLFDMYVGKHLADNGGLGIGEMVKRYMQYSATHEQPTKPTTPSLVVRHRPGVLGAPGAGRGHALGHSPLPLGCADGSGTR